MNEKTTKIAIIVLLSLILFSAVISVYFYLFSNDTPQATTDEETVRKELFPPAVQNSPVKAGARTSTQRIDGGAEAQNREDNGASSTGTGVTILDTRHISLKPTSEPSFAVKYDPKTKIKKLSVRYMERGTGHIYELPVDRNEPRKISDTTITKVYETLWGEDGKTVITRRLGDTGLIENLYGFIAETTTGDEIDVGNLDYSKVSGDITAITVSPDKTKFFYLNKVNDDAVGYISDFTAQTLPAKRNQIFSSPIGSWNISWPNSNIISLLTRPSGTIPGSIYFLNIRAQLFERILGGINGLTALVSRDAKKILYTNGGKGGISTYVYSTDTNISDSLPIKTFADKCVWSFLDSNIVYCAIPTDIPTGNYPDDWYQGGISFNDEIWKIDIKTPKTEIIASKNLFERDGGVDVSSLVLSPDEEYLTFTNKKDSTPWLIKTRQ
ncbi:MAG: hypothetical protein HZA94_02775 [Candidatus Vogelbacteria bacterium]|nr:hypothetical protein [Candidatus Vogelbacteria bacterium]